MTREPVGEHYVRKLLAMSSCFIDGQGSNVCFSEPCACAQTLLQEIGRPLQDEIERLTLENWQLKGALGYPVPGDIPQGPFKCGLCEARALEEQAMTQELGYGTRLAEALWEKHWKTEAPDWKPLPDLLGVLTQIDNMTAGLVRAALRSKP